MNPIFSAGVLIGVLCGAWTFVMGFTGWYRDPALALLFLPAVIIIEIAGLYWGLRRTAAQGRNYAGQVVAGAMMSAIAGVIVICSSLLFTMVAFPGYFQELEALQRQLLAEAGRPAAEIEAAVQASASTPMAQAMSGFIGTFITGIIVSGIIAIWVRAKPGAGAWPQRTMA
jgi:hypothetical protein